MPTEISKTTCAVCGRDAALMCQRCSEPYCNDVCQREDWQRHKYFCVVMPPLVANFGLKQNSGNVNSMQKRMDSATLVPLPISTNWREHLLPPEGGEYFECRVTYIEDNGIIWVIDMANTGNLDSFSERMFDAMRKRKPCIRVEDLSVDALVGVNIEKKIFRGKVLALHPKLKQADICLIDYGPLLKTTLDNIYLPLGPMMETKAFAFRVKLPNNNEVQINKNITLRLQGTKTHNGVYHVQLKPKMAIPLYLPVKMLQSNANVDIVHIFKRDSTSKQEQYVALLQMKELNNLNDDLTAALKDKNANLFTKPLLEGLAPTFVAAYTQQGYRRAFLLDFFEKPKPLYLVYEMDEGRITITNELRRIPNELLVHPMRVFAITFGEGCVAKLDGLKSSDNVLTIKFKEKAFRDNVEKIRSAGFTLLGSNDEPICEGRGEMFFGHLADLGVKFWLEPFSSGQLVFITRVLGHDELYISSVETKKYTEIFCHLKTKCKRFDNPNDIINGGIVLAICPTQGTFRGEITESLGNGKYTVRNVDTGHLHQVAAEVLYTPCRFIQNMPVSLTRIKLKTICDIPSTAVPANNAAHQMLQVLCARKEEWVVNFIEDNGPIAELLLAKEKESLINRLLPLIFTPGERVDTEDKTTSPTITSSVPEKRQASSAHILNVEATNLPSLPPSPATSLKSFKLAENSAPEMTSSVERFYLKDLALNTIPIGDKLEVLLLNSAGMHKTGIIFACYFPDDKALEEYQETFNKVLIYGEDTKTSVAGYVPGIGEMCTAMFEEDKSWYRGVCQGISGDKVNILFYDFGNSEVVPLDLVKPITRDLLNAVNATKCYIKGFDEDKDFLLVEKYLSTQLKLLCDVHKGPEPNTRTLTIPNLDEILSKEASEKA